MSTKRQSHTPSSQRVVVRPRSKSLTRSPHSGRQRVWHRISDQRLTGVIQAAASIATLILFIYGLIAAIHYVTIDSPNIQAQARLQTHLSAWQIIDVAQGQGGSGGRIEALQALNNDGVALDLVTITGANLNDIQLPHAHLSNANLRDDDFLRANLKLAYLPHADLTNAYLAFSDLDAADLAQAKLSKADLVKANLYYTQLDDANLQGADLSGADLRMATLGGANLQMATLNEANLRGVNLDGVNLRGARLVGADLTGANLRGSLNTTPAQLAQAKSLKGATMPDGTKHQ